MKQLLIVAILGVALAGGMAVARTPAANVRVQAHPNIAAAQRLCVQAYDKVVAAQKANEYDLGGHAQRAKDLLEQASQELKLAAETANENAAAK